jgi:hypothetical protein
LVDAGFLPTFATLKIQLWEEVIKKQKREKSLKAHSVNQGLPVQKKPQATSLHQLRKKAD